MQSAFVEDHDAISASDRAARMHDSKNVSLEPAAPRKGQACELLKAQNGILSATLHAQDDCDNCLEQERRTYLDVFKEVQGLQMYHKCKPKYGQRLRKPGFMWRPT